MKDLDKKEVYGLRGITEEQAKELLIKLGEKDKDWVNTKSNLENLMSAEYLVFEKYSWLFGFERQEPTTHISTLFEEKSLEQELEEAETKVAELKKQIEERDKPKVGDVCKFWDDEPNRVIIGHYNGFENHYHRHTSSRGGFMNAKKLTQQEVIDLLFGN